MMPDKYYRNGIVENICDYNDKKIKAFNELRLVPRLPHFNI